MSWPFVDDLIILIEIANDGLLLGTHQ